MARPSEGWAGFGHLDPETEQYDRMQKLLSSANFDYLESRATIARSSKEKLPANVTCTIDTSCFTWGFMNVVFEAAFSDGVYWIVRIQHDPLNADTDEENNIFMSEIETMALVRSRTTIPVAQIFDYGLSTENPCGYPYMLMEFLPGQPCKDILSKAVTREYRAKVAKQLANVYFELESLTFKNIGRVSDKSCDPILPGVSTAIDSSKTPRTSLEYFHEIRAAESQEILALHSDDADWRTASWILKIALPHMILDDRIHGPFPLCHVDLHYGNLLFDKDFNLTGVLDWTHAQALPLERLGIFMEFMLFPAAPEVINAQIIEFRSLFLQCLKDKEASRPSSPTSTQTQLSTFMGSARAELAYFCTYSNPRRALWDAKRAAKVIFGDSITWGQLRDVYGARAFNEEGVPLVFDLTTS
ncbi:hypothetical protein FQN57_000782 [Myotisia sp. PD_48]|nr:hypothetical protein FQN57_000782 [Myotisia sp. PD_48]